MLKHTHQLANPQDTGNTALVQPSWWNEDHEIDNGGVLAALASGTPATPAAGKVRITARQSVGVRELAMTDEAGRTFTLGNPAFNRTMAVLAPSSEAAGLQNSGGFPAMSTTTASARVVTGASKLASMSRTGFASAATAGSVAGMRATFANSSFQPSNGAGIGGFLCSITMGISDPATVAGARWFFGLRSTSPTLVNAEPSTYTDSIGVAQLSTDANQLYLCFGGAAAQTPIALGATDFPINTTTPYRLTVYNPANVAGTFYVEVKNLATGAVFTTTLTGASAPTYNSLVCITPWAIRSNNATALSVAMDFCESWFVKGDI